MRLKQDMREDWTVFLGTDVADAVFSAAEAYIKEFERGILTADLSTPKGVHHAVQLQGRVSGMHTMLDFLRKEILKDGTKRSTE